jgi:hypothetical protein
LLANCRFPLFGVIQQSMKYSSMKAKIIIASLTTLLVQAAFAQITVPGTSNPWLAGMPNGSTSIGGDSAPAESPTLVTGISIVGGTGYSFSASGGVSVDPRLYLYPLTGPDGNASDPTTHIAGVENGIANVTVPLEALVGVFIGSTPPNLNPAPGPLDFTTLASQDYLSLSPELQQPFFIGDGLTSSGIVQQVIAPAGATQLYLGMMDPQGYYNNVGSFTVEVSAVPEPNMAGTAAIILAALGVCTRGSRKDKPAI